LSQLTTAQNETAVPRRLEKGFLPSLCLVPSSTLVLPRQGEAAQGGEEAWGFASLPPLESNSLTLKSRETVSILGDE